MPVAHKIKHKHPYNDLSLKKREFKAANPLMSKIISSVKPVIN